MTPELYKLIRLEPQNTLKASPLKTAKPLNAESSLWLRGLGFRANPETLTLNPKTPTLPRYVTAGTLEAARYSAGGLLEVAFLGTGEFQSLLCWGRALNRLEARAPSTLGLHLQSAAYHPKSCAQHFNP